MGALNMEDVFEIFFRAIGRVLLYLLVDVLLELLVKGTGYFVLRRLFFRKDPGETACLVAGLITLGLIGCAVFFLSS